MMQEERKMQKEQEAQMHLNNVKRSEEMHQK